MQVQHKGRGSMNLSRARILPRRAKHPRTCSYIATISAAQTLFLTRSLQARAREKPDFYFSHSRERDARVVARPANLKIIYVLLPKADIHVAKVIYYVVLNNDSTIITNQRF